MGTTTFRPIDDADAANGHVADAAANTNAAAYFARDCANVVIAAAIDAANSRAVDSLSDADADVADGAIAEVVAACADVDADAASFAAKDAL